MSYVIRLYIMDDCEGCKILRRNIIESIEKYSNLCIDLEEINVTNKTRKYLSYLGNYKVHDFPAFQLVKDGAVVLSDCGSRPIAFIQRYIDLYFK